MTGTLSSWFSHPGLIWGLGGFSVLAVALSILLVPRYLASLPADFLRTGARPERASMPWRIARNALGVVLVLLGIAMLLLPGQGLLTLVVGLMLIDFPGRQKLIQGLLRRPKVLKVVNKLRARHEALPLQV